MTILSMDFLGERLLPAQSVKDLGLVVDPHFQASDIQKLSASWTAKLLQINRENSDASDRRARLIIALLFGLVLLKATSRKYNSSRILLPELLPRGKGLMTLLRLLLEWLPIKDRLLFLKTLY